MAQPGTPSSQTHPSDAPAKDHGPQPGGMRNAVPGKDDLPGKGIPEQIEHTPTAAESVDGKAKR